MKMKQSFFYFCLILSLFFFAIFSSSSLVANSEDINPGQEEAKLFSVRTSPVPDIPPEDDAGESISELMGMEICEEADKECLRRRMVAEAHLDYIYTQHHKH